jgi:uncharacterized protein YutE (UPF0331/DUF86 family)
VDALERIRKQVELVEELLGELETEKSYRGIERLVQLIVQALLDLGLMVVAALGLRRPRAYSEVGYILWEQGVLSRHDAEMLRSMAGLGNVLVHAYARVDRGRIFEFAERLKVDARRVASAVLKGVEGKPIDPPEDSVAGMVEKLKRALSGKVVLALLYGGRAKGYALKGDYDVAVLMEQGVRPVQAWGAGRRRGGSPRGPRGARGRGVHRRAAAGARAGGFERGPRDRRRPGAAPRPEAQGVAAAPGPGGGLEELLGSAALTAPPRP